MSTESTADQRPSYNSNNQEASEGSSEPFFDPLADDNPDRSYQFSYGSKEEDASREEVSDSKGEKHNVHYLIRASMVLVNFFGNNIDDVPGGFEIFT